MSLAGIYFFLALLSVYCTFTAIVQARRIYWLVPVYFFSAWLCGELALIHLLWQVSLTSLVAFQGVFADPLAQTGLGFFAMSWLGLIYSALPVYGYAQPAPPRSAPGSGG